MGWSCSPSGRRLKSVCHQHLSENSGAIGRPTQDRPLAQGNRRRPLGTILPHEPVIKTENGTRKFMLRTTLASSRALRAFALGLITVSATIIFTTENADARRYRGRHHVR